MRTVGKIDASGAGQLRYRVRCIDKLGRAFRGDEKLLDAGCGDGGVARLLRERVKEVVGVDVEAVAAWRGKSGLTFTVANAERLPFDDVAQNLIEEAVESFPPFRPFPSYNFAVA